MNQGIMSYAGLPLGRAAASGLPIGASLVMPDSLDIVTLADSSRWLRRGIFAEAAAYPRAFALEHLRGLAFADTGHATLSGIAARVVGDGAGTFLLLTTAALYRSTDNGVTWASATLPGSVPHEVLWLNNKFWLLYNDTASIIAYESATGADGTWTTRNVAAPGGLTAKSAMLDWTGTNYVVTAAPMSNAYTSPTGAAWTARALGAAVQTSWRLAAAASTGSVVLTLNSTSYYHSADHGVTWSSLISHTVVTANTVHVFSVGDRFYLATDATTGQWLWSTTTPAVAGSWQLVVLPGGWLGSASGASNAGFLLGSVYRNAARTAAYAHTNPAEGVRPALVLHLDASGGLSVRHSNALRSTPLVACESACLSVAPTPARVYRAGSGADGNAVVSSSLRTPATGVFEDVTYTRVA